MKDATLLAQDKLAENPDEQQLGVVVCGKLKEQIV